MMLSKKEIYEMVAKKQISSEEALEYLKQLPSTNDNKETIKNQSYPLSEGQKALWIHFQMMPDSYAYNLPVAYWIDRTIDIAALKRALHYLYDRYFKFCITVQADSEVPMQTILLDDRFPFNQYDISNLSDAETLLKIKEEARRPFDLESDHLMRMALFTRVNNDFILLMNFHHIIIDGVSLQIFIKKLQECYSAEKNGKRCDLSNLDTTYKDFVEWQKKMLESKDGQQLKKYWHEQLSGTIPSLELYIKKPRTSSPTYQGATHTEEINNSLIQRLSDLSISEDITLFTVMLTAYNILLYRYSYQEDILIGTAMSGRTESQFENVIGYFMNMVVIRSNLSGNPHLRMFLKQVHETVLYALAHSSYPFFTLLQELRKDQRINNPNIFHAAFYFQGWVKELYNDLKGMDSSFLIKEYDCINQEGEFDLTLEVIRYEDRCVIHFKYNPDIYEEETICNLTKHYVQILHEMDNSLEKNISHISLLTKEEEHKLLVEFNNAKIDYPRDKCMPELFEEQAYKTPDAIAVRFEDKQMTYKELNTKATQLAIYLNQNGVVAGTLVGIFMERSIDMLIGLLGILKAGGAYVPMDPIYPADRLLYMLEDTRLSILITESSIENRLPDYKVNVIRLDTDWDVIEQSSMQGINDNDIVLDKMDPDNIAYVIYTSGSTGKPKGVEVLHRGLTNFLCSMAEKPGFTDKDYMLALTTICFDIAALELYLPIITGGQVEILPDYVIKDGISLKEKIETRKATVMQATPATWQMLLAAEWKGDKAIKILCGGEALSRELADNLLDRGRDVWNMYGPTETTIWSSISKVERDKEITIGQPIANTQFYILDKNLTPVLIGVSGDLYIGGDGLARGYHNRPDLTKEKFIPNPFGNDNNSRIYNTGDTARYLSDGTVQCLGRTDNQIKLRGFRIELGEIEEVLQKQKWVREAVVVLKEDDLHNKHLAAFILPEGSNKILSNNEWAGILKEWLPPYMIPSSFIMLNRFPLTQNMKIDRKVLSNLHLSEILAQYGDGIIRDITIKDEKSVDNNRLEKEDYNDIDDYLIGMIEEDLVEIISKIVNCQKSEIDRCTNIGEYGFDSIRFTTLSLRLNKKYEIKLNATIFFQYSTVEMLSSHLLTFFSEQMKGYYSEEIKKLKVGLGKDKIKGIVQDKRNLLKSVTDTGNKVSLHEEKPVDAIAVIGMHGIMPASKNLREFWENLISEKDAITEIPDNRFDLYAYNNDFFGNHTIHYCNWGGFIDDVDKFDASFFGISPREADLMDPQQRILLETVWKTIEDAGYKASDFSGTKTGVFIGTVTSDYKELIYYNRKIDGHSITGLAHSILANRISYQFNLHGPSEAIDTACSSSLVAIHRAIESMKYGSCDAAIAGGVNIILSPSLYIALGMTDMLSKDGRCKTFDESANGYVRGEGVCTVLLKSLTMAEMHGDHIYAVIRGSAENHGGRTNSLTAPNPNAQADLLVKAYERSGIDPSTISYIETHGTGTALGDPIEINGLKLAFDILYKKWNHSTFNTVHCGLGSVKTNIGHLEATAGIAGLFKILLSLKYKILPANLYYINQNSYIDLHDTPFYIVNKKKKWESLKNDKDTIIPRRAGVSSFGFGGTNVHIILEEYNNHKINPCTLDDPYIFVLSARNEERLKEYAYEMLHFLNWATSDKNENSAIEDSDLEGNGHELFLADIAYTLQIGREAMEERLAVVVSSIKDLKEKIACYCNGDDAEDLYKGNVKTNRSKSDFLIEGNEIDEFIRLIIHNKNYSKIAQFWTAGINIDWELLYSTISPNRISLPTYPFARERYWMSDSIKNDNLFSDPRNQYENKKIDSVEEGDAEKSEIMFYQMKWEESEYTYDTKSRESHGTILIFHNGDITDDVVKRNIKDTVNIERFILIKKGQCYQNCGNHTYEIDPANPDDYYSLFKVLKESELLPTAILYFWSCRIEYDNMNMIDDEYNIMFFNNHFLNSIHSIFYLIKILHALKIKSLVRLICVNSSNDMSDPFFDAVSGYSKSLGFILPNLKFSLIQLIQKYDIEEMLNSALKEMTIGDNYLENEIRYKDNKRYILKLKSFELNQINNMTIKKEGVYLITGGTGALGLHFSRYLSRKYNARIILIGRSDLNGSKERAVQELGSDVLYLKADVTKLDEMTMVMDIIKEKYHSLNGVIHAAGTFNENLIIDKGIEEFDSIIGPKIIGTLIVDHVTRTEDLDFFIMFSSLSSLLGDFGQCDYAIGNRFMDSYAVARDDLRCMNKRHGVTMSINWPLWRQGGMHFNSEGEALYLQSSGMTYLETEPALESFEEIIRTGCFQIALVSGYKNRINAYFNRECGAGDSIIKIDSTLKSIERSGSMLDEKITHKINKDILILISEILKIDQNKLDVNENFGNYGFDSIMLKEFAHRISERYRIDLSPTVFFNQSNINSLSSYLQENYSDAIKAFYMKENSYLLKSDQVINTSIQARINDGNHKKSIEDNRKEKVAVVGMSALLPGARDLQEFWTNLLNERDLITVIPEERWDWFEYYGDPKIDTNKSNSKWGGFIRDIDKFDCRFFNISPLEAEFMDPQHRLFLECVWKTVEDAGYRISELSDKSVTVFVGMEFNDYHKILANSKIEAQLGLGNVRSMLANRVSYLFNLRGASEVIDTACSSSLVAIHRAVKSIQYRECDLAIAGGVSLIIDPQMFLITSQLGVLSSDGRCKTFDKDANGYVRSEGIASILLKPLSKAIEDNDCIHAVIRGSAVNHGGKANSLTAPNSKAQAELLVAAYEDAEVDPGTITYIETHGTATELGDPVEIDGIKSAFNELAKKRGAPINKNYYCGLGSVKTNIGHLEPASGIAGIIKVILSIKNKVLPRILHFNKLNPYINLNETPFYIVDRTKFWEKEVDSYGNPILRRAGVSSFGVGGTNAHVVLEEYDNIPIKQNLDSPQIVVLSAKNEERLKAYAGQIVDFLEKADVLSNKVHRDMKLVVYLQEEMRSIMSDIQHVSISDIDIDEDIIDICLDPISLTAFMNRINERFNLTLLPDIILEHRSITLFSKFLSERYSTINDNISCHAPNNLEEHDANSNINLMSIAYTLQTGREAMEERLAMVVSSLNELKNKLMDYVNDKSNIDDLYTCNIKKNRINHDQLLAGKTGERFIKLLIDEMDLNKLAQLWASGIDINWRLLYSTIPFRISLPTYPFARERYWVSNSDAVYNNQSIDESASYDQIGDQSEDFDSPTVLYYEIIKERRDINRVKGIEPSDRFLLFDINDDLYNTLIQYRQDSAEHNQVFLVKPGLGYKHVHDGIYEIDPCNLDDYRKLIEEFQNQKYMPNKIIHIWSDEILDFNGEGIHSGILKGFYSMFNICRALLEQKRGNRIQILYVYQRSENNPQPLYAAMSGFFKSVHMESRAITGRTVQIIHSPDGKDLKTPAHFLELLLGEFHTKNPVEELEVYYDGDVRFIKHIKEMKSDNFTGDSHLLKQDGVYLITGGAGELGLIFAEYIVQQVRAKLVLTGRSDLSIEKRNKIEKLESSGSQVVYIKADIFRRDEVKNLISSVKSKFNRIDGIIHCAGVKRDSLIIKKSKDEIDDVLASKIFGTIYLDEVTEHENLDFFVMFSSTSAVIGNAGQSDYAYSNSFMDNYTELREKLRRNGRTLSINWPLWKEGGMRVDEETELFFARSGGIYPLEKDMGTFIFSRAFALDKNQLMVLYGNQNKIRSLLGLMDEYFNNKDATRVSIAGFDKTDLLEKFKNDLKGYIVNNLKINEHEIDFNEDIAQYGFDSILFIKFANVLNEKYNFHITPAIFYECSSIESLADCLFKEYTDNLVQYYQEYMNGFHKKTRDHTIAQSKKIKPKIQFKTLHSEKNRLFHEPIAIVGMSGIMPRSDDLEIFWKHLEEGDDLVTEIPKERWEWDKYFGDPIKEKNRTDSKWGGFINNVDKFDALFFNISPGEAELMDPQQRIFLQTVWETIEDAGYRASDLSGTKTGLFVGVSGFDYYDLMREKAIEINGHSSTGISHSILANRISYLLNLHGPSEPIDTACSSSLVSLNRAVLSIWSGVCDQAIAGGINIILNSIVYISLSKAGMLSKDGKCKTFDKNADGYVRGEGSGAVLLKPLSNAEADGDHIYAVVRASVVKHGGHANSLTAPNVNSQADLLIEAYEKAGIDPSTVNYIEAHGTGTNLGDPVEINGLTRAFRELYNRQGKVFSNNKQCVIGSVKTNVGHLESAAGIAGVIKVILSMKYKKIPANVHFYEINPYIHLDDTPFYIVNKTVPWEQIKNDNNHAVPRRAGISSFGYGGANSHVILEEYSTHKSELQSRINDLNLFILSAKDEERLKVYCKKIIHYLEEIAIKKDENNIRFDDLAYTSQVGREPMEERLAIVASNIDELRNKLLNYYRGEINSTGIYRGSVKRYKLKSEISNQEFKGEELIKSSIDNNEFEFLAERWVWGEDIDWQLLYEAYKPRRISMPTYPFVMQRYWIPESHDVSLMYNGNGKALKLHPMIDSNESTFTEHRFTKQLTGNEFYMSGCVAGGEKILPGMAHIEMARAAGEIAGKNKVKKIKNVLWSIPISGLGNPIETSISLYRNRDMVDYEISSMVANDKRLIHSQGRVIYDIHRRTKSEYMDIGLIKNRCSERLSGDECYSMFASRGLHYGSGYKLIKDLYYNDRESIAYLELPEVWKSTFEKYGIHPGILEGAMQSIIGLIDKGTALHGKLYYTLSLEEIELYKPLTERCYAYVELLNNNNESKKNEIKWHVYILDESGELLIRMYDLSITEFYRKNKSMQNEDIKAIEYMLHKLKRKELNVKEIEKFIGGIYE